jgi:hypothetical protein
MPLRVWQSAALNREKRISWSGNLLPKLARFSGIYVRPGRICSHGCCNQALTLIDPASRTPLNPNVDGDLSPIVSGEHFARIC